MEATNKTIEKHLARLKYQVTYPNTLAVKDELESDYDREDYESVDDAIEDAIENLESMHRLTR